MPGFGASDALVRRRTRRGLLAVIAVALPLVLAILCGATGQNEYQFIAAVLALVEALGFLLLPAIAPDGIFTGEHRGPLRADRAGVHFRKKLVLARDQIQSSWVEALQGGGRCVHLSTKRGKDELSIEVEDDNRARSLLEALELRHDRHAASFIVESAPLRTSFMQRLSKALVYLGGAMLAGTVLYSAHRNALIGFALVPVLIVYSMVLHRARLMSRVVVGADGLVVRAGGALRQIPLSSVRKVEPSGGESVVELVSGESLTFRFAGEGADEKSAAFGARLQESLVRIDRSPNPVASLLVPAGRAATDWLDDLRRVTSGRDGYRGGAVPDEELWRIAENPGVDSGARAGALAALRPRLDDGGRARIGAIAGATAQRDLRAALEAAAAGESEESILEAFERESGNDRR